MSRNCFDHYMRRLAQLLVAVFVAGGLVTYCAIRVVGS